MNLEGITRLGNKVKNVTAEDLGRYVGRIVGRVKNLTWEDYKAGGRIVRKEAALSFVSTTGIMVASSPIQVVADTALNEGIGQWADFFNWSFCGANNLMAMTNDKSIGGKMGMALLMYGGFGFLYDKLRGVSREFFGLSNPQDKKTESLLKWHDRGITLLYSSAMLIGGYHLFGEHNWTKIGWATFVSGVTQYHRGFLVGYAVDVYKDLLGFKECNRINYPKAIKNLGKVAKAGVAVLGVAGAIGLMAGMYSLTPKEWSNNPHRLAERQEIRAYYNNNRLEHTVK